MDVFTEEARETRGARETEYNARGHEVTPNNQPTGCIVK